MIAVERSKRAAVGMLLMDQRQRVHTPRSPHHLAGFLWGWGWLILLAGSVIVCHGCHGGDHDDELMVMMQDR